MADFIGSANFVPGRYDGHSIDVFGYRRPHAQDIASGPVTVMVRPEAIEFAREGEEGVEATYLSSAYLGPVTEYIFDIGGVEVFATISGLGMSSARRGDTVLLRFNEAGVSLLPPE